MKNEPIFKLSFMICLFAVGCCGSGSWFNAASAMYRRADLQPLAKRSLEYNELIEKLGQPDLTLSVHQLEAKLGTQPMATYGNYRAYVLAQLSESTSYSSGTGANVVDIMATSECLIYQGQSRYVFPDRCDGNFTAFIFLKRGDRIVGSAFINPWFTLL